MDLKYKKLLVKLEFTRRDRYNLNKVQYPFDHEIQKLGRSIKHEVIETADMVDYLTLQLDDQDDKIDNQTNLIAEIMQKLNLKIPKIPD